MWLILRVSCGFCVIFEVLNWRTHVKNVQYSCNIIATIFRNTIESSYKQWGNIRVQVVCIKLMPKICKGESPTIWRYQTSVWHWRFACIILNFQLLSRTPSIYVFKIEASLCLVENSCQIIKDYFIPICPRLNQRGQKYTVACATFRFGEMQDNIKCNFKMKKWYFTCCQHNVCLVISTSYVGVLFERQGNVHSSKPRIQIHPLSIYKQNKTPIKQWQKTNQRHTNKPNKLYRKMPEWSLYYMFSN